VSFYSLLVVKPDSPWKTIQECIAAAEASPGKLRVGSPGEGTASHLGLEELKRRSAVNLTHAPFSG
jgi:tripartite-type tricarboxylate transporter receptor subunit TctC